jgi:serine/threonine-protein kinase
MSTDALAIEGAPRPGEIFAEKYRIERVLGVGGMGYVLAATHLHLDQRVAIKMLLPDLARHPDTVARFLREGRAAVKIRSEHVGRVLDVGSHEGTHFIVMEYLEGCDLSQLLEREGRLPEKVAVDYLLQACEAIAEAHAMHTVHRDLKPANLFLVRRADGAPCVKVLDFGISKTTAPEGSAQLSMTKTSSLMGSPLYMSPEQLKSAKDVDERADIWALGVILFELLAGRPPFLAETLPELGSLVLSGHVPDVRQLAPATSAIVAAAIGSCLTIKAAERFPSVAELAATLAPFGSPAASLSAARIQRVLENVSRPPASTWTSETLRAAASSVSAKAFTVTPESSAGVDWAASTALDASATADPNAPREKRRSWLPAVAVLAVAITAGGAFGVKRVLSTRDAPVNAVSPDAAEPHAAVVQPASSSAETASAAPPIASPAMSSATTTTHAIMRPRPSAAASTIPVASVAVTPAIPTSTTSSSNGFSNNRHE